MLEQGLVALLVGTPAVSDLVADRIYPVQGPPDDPAYPYVTYQAVTAGSDYTLDGAESRRKRIQFDCWAQEVADNANVLTAFRNVLTGLVTTLNEGTRVLFASRENELSDFDNASKSFRWICEYEFLFVEP